MPSSAYTVGFAYANGGGNQNLTGSPDYGARVVVIGDPGKGCSDDPLRQFNTSAFRGPAVGSVGLESGNDYLTGCFISALDLAIRRNIRLGGSRVIELRADMFNAFDQAGITGRNTTMNLNNPADPDDDHQPAVQSRRHRDRRAVAAARRGLRRRHRVTRIRGRCSCRSGSRSRGSSFQLSAPASATTSPRWLVPVAGAGNRFKA